MAETNHRHRRQAPKGNQWPRNGSGRKKLNNNWSRKPNGDVTEEEAEKMKQRSMRFAKKDEPVRQQYGFLSRGEDDRLQKSDKHRRELFNQILKSFAAFCTQVEVNNNISEFVSRKLKQLSIEETTEEKSGDEDKNRKKEDGNKPDKAVSMDSILTSLRKLREALIHTTVDDFSKEVFLFSIRISVNVQHYQTYIPSINFLLGLNKLTKEETKEVASILVLHVLHFNQEYNFSIRLFYKYLDPETDQKVLSVIRSYMANDYYTWTKLYNEEVGSAASAMMRYGIKRMVQVIVECLSSSYFSMDVRELEKLLPNGVTYETITKEHKLMWQKEGNNIVIRQRAKR